MLLYDISTDILTAKVYDGDPTPNLEYIKSCDNGDDYNLSVLNTCMHTGTHIDSPYHFDSDGKKIEDMKLSVFYGKCTVVTIKGILTGEDMERLLPYCKRRLILHGDGEACLSYSAAVVLADSERPTCVEDGSLVMGNLMNAAHALGVGSCWIHRARQVFDSAEGKALLRRWGLPETLIGIGHCILGYPSGPLLEAKPRKDNYIVKI